MILHVADAVENVHLVNWHDSKLRAFFRSVFPTILEPDTGLFILEGILSVLRERKYNILPTLFPKAFGPSNSTFLFGLHALAVCDTASFSAGHGIAIKRKNCYYKNNEEK